MIKSLQSLRLVFAIMIFLHHFHYNGEVLFLAGGPLGVCFFIMLSGFVMSIGYGEKTLPETFDFKSYYKKRIIRLWPLHLLCLFAFVMMNIPECVSSFKHIGLLGINALMLQSWIPIKGVYFSGNAVSWCLCDLMFCYLMFPLLFRAISKTSTKHLSIVFMMALAGYFTALQFIPDGMTHAFVYISPIFRLCDFIIGILAYKVYQTLRNCRLTDWIQNSSKITLTLVEIFLIALLLLCIVLYPSISKTYSLTSMWWPIYCGLIVMFTLLNTYGGGYLSDILQKRWLLKVSEYSFTFYMIHQLSIKVVKKLFSVLPLELPFIIELIVCLSLVLFIAGLVNRYFEKPVANYLTKKI